MKRWSALSAGIVALALAPSASAGPQPIGGTVNPNGTWEVVTTEVIGEEEDSEGNKYRAVYVEEVAEDSPASVGSPDQIAGYPVKCRRVKGSILYEGTWPTYQNLWRYSMRQGFCHNGNKVTSLYHFKRWSEYANYSWDFEGHIDYATSGCAGCWSVYRFTQGKYRYCQLGICTKTKTPWIEIIVRGNGTRTINKHDG